MGSQRSLREVGELVAGRRFFVAGVALTVLLLALLSAFILPRQYESETTVRLLDNHALLTAYGRTSGRAEPRAVVIGRFREELTGRDAVLATVSGLDLERTHGHLSPAERAAKGEEIARLIREGTRVEEMPGAPGEHIFRVSARGTDPELSLRVLTHLVTGYQRRRFEQRERGASDEYAKLRDQATATEAEHEVAAKALAEFLAAHQEHRFGESTDTASRLTREKEDLEKIDKKLAALGTRLKDVREQIADEKEWRDLEEGEESGSGKVQNEVWTDLKASERAVVSEMAVKQRMRKVHAARVDDLSALVRDFPELEARWKDLVRSETKLVNHLASLRDQEKTAREEWQAKATEGALVFDVLDAPSRPAAPAGNQPLLLSFAGLVLGVCGGLGSVVVMGMADKSFHRSDEVAGALDVPVLGAIARIETPVEREETNKRKRRAAMTVLVLAVLAGGALVAQLVFDEPISSFVRNTVSL